MIRDLIRFKRKVASLGLEKEFQLFEFEIL